MTETASNRPGTVRVSFDPAQGVLTAVLESSSLLDPDSIVDGFVAHFDRQEPGRLASVQAQVPQSRQGAWRTILPDYLGPTVAARCLAHIDTSRYASEGVVVIPSIEWTDLRSAQWPRLHEAARSWLGANPLPAAASVSQTDTTSAAITSELAHARRQSFDGKEGRFETALIPSFAYRCGVEPAVTVSVYDRVARMEATPRRGAALRLSATVIQPEPAGLEPVPFRRDGRVAVVEQTLLRGVASSGLPRVVLHAARTPQTGGYPTPAVDAGYPARGNVVFLFKDTGRALVADRELSKAVGFAGVKTGMTGGRFFFRGTGRTPMHVEVTRQGRTLWARGFAGKTRRNRAVFVACRLRAEVVELLRPNGDSGSGAVLLSAEGLVDEEGYFGIRLATVEGERVRGDLVESLELQLD